MSILNPRTVQQQLATLLEGTPAEKIMANLADGLRDKLLSALGGMSATERDEVGQRLMRMTPDSADSVIANVVGSAHTDSTYTVRSGDSLSKIAKAKGVSLAALEEANPQIKNRDLIHPNQVLNLPRQRANA